MPLLISSRMAVSAFASVSCAAGELLGAADGETLSVAGAEGEGEASVFLAPQAQSVRSTVPARTAQIAFFIIFSFPPQRVRQFIFLLPSRGGFFADGF